MDDLATECGALFEATVFLSHFNDLPDPRHAVKVVYPLDEVLLLALLAVLAGAEAFTDIARSGHKKAGRAPIHMVSAFAARQRLVLGQVKVAKDCRMG